MKKLCFLLCLLLTLTSLIACGDKEEPEKDPPETTPGDTTQEEGLVLSVSDEITIGVGDTKQITAINSKTGMQTSNVLWKSDNEAVAKVDYEGKITAIADGTAVITAESIVDSALSASCTVKVTSVLSGIKLNTNELSIAKGGTAELTVGFIPESFTGAKLTWVSSDESIASVENGAVKAHKNGSATIAVTAVSDGKEFTAVCSVSVITPVSSIELSKTELSLAKGESTRLNTTIKPADATNDSLTWTSSNPETVSVADDGTVTALKGGTATITAKTSNDLTASCTVTVSVPVTGVTVTPSELPLDPGATYQLTFAIAPVDADEQGVIWDIADPTIVSVDANGVVTALKAGTTTIKVITVDGYYESTCTVTVSNTITGLSFEQTEGSLLIGETITLVPVKAPVDAEDTTYIWTPADPLIATVDANGLVTAVGAGTTTITVATDKGVSAIYTLVVVDPATLEVPITKLEATDKSVNVGDVFKIDVVVTPADATEKYVITSRNPSCVVVNEDGTLTAIRRGTVIIEIKGEKGEEDTLCIVTVNDVAAEQREQLQREYNNALVGIENAHAQVLSDIGTRYDNDIQVLTDAINNAETQDEAYQLSVQRLNSLKQSKQSEIDAEETAYQQKLADLKNQYAFLFE